MKLIVSLDGEILTPFQVYVDLAYQLSCFTVCDQVFSPICELNGINDWINLESFGQSMAMRANNLHELLRDKLKFEELEFLELQVIVGKGELSMDNVYALLFIAKEIKNLKVFFYAPPTLFKQLAKKIDLLSDLDNLQVELCDIAHAQMDKKACEKLAEHRKQLLQRIGIIINGHSNEVINPSCLIAYAWICLKAGAYELGESSLQQVLLRTDSTTALYEQLFMHLQLIRFLSHRYDAVAQVDFPETFKHLSQEEIISTYFIKAYSATLTRNLQLAAIYFTKCDVNEKMILSDENSLYRLNLFALFLALSGNFDGAYAAEIRIKKHIELNKFKAVGLKYVNYINIARLHKKFKQYEQALSYYELAYLQIGGGGHTISDRIYYNINIGNVYEAAGHAEVALSYWLKVAMIWLAWGNKYSLSWRPRVFLTQENVADILQPLPVKKISEFLYKKIIKLIHDSKLIYAIEGSYQFVLHSALEKKITHETCYVGHHMMLYGSSTEASFSYKDEEEKLAKLISPIVKKMMNIKTHHAFLAIDVVHEYFPTLEEHCHSLTCLGDVKDSCLNGKYLCNENAKGGKLKISLSKGIDYIRRTNEGMQIAYKRSFLNKILQDPQEIEFVAALEKTPILSIPDVASIKDILNKLFAKKIICISY
jgi:tetratricopeptide (TPR) repeat protein